MTTTINLVFDDKQYKILDGEVQQASGQSFRDLATNRPLDAYKVVKTCIGLAAQGKSPVVVNDSPVSHIRMDGQWVYEMVLRAINSALPDPATASALIIIRRHRAERTLWQKFMGDYPTEVFFTFSVGPSAT